MDIEKQILILATEYYRVYKDKQTAFEKAVNKAQPTDVYRIFDITNIEYTEYLCEKYTEKDLQIIEE
jgi:hypothetical protein